MANEDLFEFSAKYDIEVEKNSLNKAKGVLDAFYKKYNDRTMKIDTSDMVKTFRGGVLEMQKLYDQGVKEMSKNGFAWWESEDGADEIFNGVRTKMQEMLKDAKMVFSDGSIYSILDNALNDIFDEKISKGVTVVASDLGDRVQFLKNEISDAITQLNSINAIQSSHWGVYGFSGDEMTDDQLKDRISMLKKMADYQAELELFNGKKFEYEIAPAGMTTSGLTSKIKEMESDLESLQKYNLQTTEQLRRRKDLINEAQESWQWDDDDHAKAKEQIHDDYVYQANIESLQNYIDRRKEVIRKLQDNEAELFSVDGISNYVNDANIQITRLETRMQELVDLRNGKTVNADHGFAGDLTEVVQGLGKVEQAVRDVIDAFKPLTDAFANEDSAISRMVNASVSDLERLQEELKETFADIKTLSQKEFINQTVVSQAAPKNSTLSTYRNEAKTLLANMVALGKDINSANIGAFKGKVGLTANEQLFVNNFLIDAEKILKDIKKKGHTVDSIVVVYETLLEQAEYLQTIAGKTNEAIGLRNMQGEWMYSDGGMVHRDYTAAEMYKNIDTTAVDAAKSVKDLDKMISSGSKGFATKDNVTESLDELEALKTKSAAIFNDLKAQLDDLFDFSKLNPDYSYIEAITENIYQKFVDLQENIKNLGLFDEFVNNDELSKTIQIITQEGQAADIATPKKDKFTEANRRLADSMKTTGNVGESAVDAIKQEAEAVEDAYQTIAKFTFNEARGASESDFNDFANAIAKNRNLKVKTASLTRGELGSPIGGSITFVDPNTLQEIRERYSVRAKKDSEDELELYRSSYTLVENTAKAEQKAANEATRRNKAIADSNKWLIEQEDLLTKQENKYRADRGAAKPLEGTNGLIQASVLSGVDSTIDGLVENIRSRINDAKGGIITQDLKNEIVKDLNALANEIQVQQARKYQSTSLRASSIETSRDVYRNEISALEADAKKAGIYDQMSATIIALTSEVETFTEDTFVTFLENVKKAHAEFKAEKAKFGEQTQSDKVIIAQEDDMWAVHEAEKTAAAEKERQIELGLSQHAAEEAEEAERILAQSRKDADEFFKAEDEKELNALYKERSAIITRIIQLNKKLETLKTDKAKNRAKQELRRENDRLASIDVDIDEYGDLVDQNKIGKQNKRLTDNDININIDRDEKEQKTALDEEKKTLEYIISLYKQYAEAEKSLSKMQNDPSGAVHEEAIADARKDSLEAKEKLLSLGINVNNIAESELSNEEHKNALLEEQVKLEKELRDIESSSKDKTQTKENKQSQNYGKTIFNREKRYSEQIAGRIFSFEKMELSPEILKTIQTYKNAYAELEKLRNKFENDPKAEGNAALKTQFQEAAITVEKLRKELMSTFREYDKFSDISDAQLLGESIIDVTKLQNARSAMIELAASATDGKFEFKNFNAAGTEMYGVVDKGNGVLQEVTVRLNSATGEMKAFTSSTKQVTTSWSRLGDSLKTGVKQIVSQYIGFHELWQAVKTGVKYVKEIDLALTELRKVTNETDLTYRKFLQTMSQTGSQVGATVADLTSSASDWARLGYSLEESGQLAKNTAILMNVSEFDDVTKATDTLISALQAFKNESVDVGTYSMKIIDEMNEVGNAYAISTSDLADSLTRSSAALAAANNSLEESIAMTTAANTIMQDPEGVGKDIADVKNSYIG